MDKEFNEMRQRVLAHMEAQFRAMNETERRAFLDKLLGMLPYEHILALDFSYGMSPNAARGTAPDANKPYRCYECGTALDFPSAWFVDGLVYCSEHSPSLDKESQGW